MAQAFSENHMSVDEWHEAVLAGEKLFVHVVPAGVSMLPLIRGGRDDVIITPVDREIKRGDIVLFRRDDGANVMHRVFRFPGGRIETFGDGCASPDAPVLREQIWGIAAKLIRDGKTYNLDSAAARAQGYIWWIIYPFRRPRAFAGKVLRRVKRLFR